MTQEQEQTQAPTETAAIEAAAIDATDDGDASEHDEHDDDDDDKSEKREKPKKVKINFEAAMPRNEAVAYFEALVGGLRSGRIEFKQDGETLVLSPPEQLEIEVKAQAKGDKAKIVFEIAWSDRLALEIKN